MQQGEREGRRAKLGREVFRMIRGVHHIAYVVADLDKTVEMMERVFGMRPFRRETIEQAGQEVVLYDLEGGATLEVIRPLHEGTIWAEFVRQHGDGIHHIGYSVDGIDDRLRELEARGVALKDSEARRSGVGWMVASVDPKSTNGLWFQLVQP
jgi:methylmalonyl-CoA/ethylmalonyl-CoA epimerase